VTLATSSCRKKI